MNPYQPTPESASQTGTTPNTAPFQLNVILHGLWGVENNPEGIRAVTTEVHQHEIHVGDFSNTVRLTAPNHYRLGGIAGVSVQTFDVAKNLVVNGHAADLNRVVAIDFPHPRDVKSIRLIQTGGKPFFAGPDAPTTPPALAIVQVLIYDVTDPSVLRLSPLGEFPKPNADGAINLHLFAEPPDKDVAAEIVAHDIAHEHDSNHKPHFKVAFESLASAFGLRITALKTGNGNIEDGGIRGFKATDTIGSHERPPRGTARLAVSPINCEMLIANNTKPKPAQSTD